MSWVVIFHPQLDDARATIHTDALPEHEARGWEVVGPTFSPLELVTDEERAAEAAAVDDAAAAFAPPADEPAEPTDDEPDDDQAPDA